MNQWKMSQQFTINVFIFCYWHSLMCRFVALFISTWTFFDFLIFATKQLENFPVHHRLTVAVVFISIFIAQYFIYIYFFKFQLKKRTPAAFLIELYEIATNWLFSVERQNNVLTFQCETGERKRERRKWKRERKTSSQFTNVSCCFVWFH